MYYYFEFLNIIFVIPITLLDFHKTRNSSVKAEVYLKEYDLSTQNHKRQADCPVDQEFLQLCCLSVCGITGLFSSMTFLSEVQKKVLACASCLTS